MCVLARSDQRDRSPRDRLAKADRAQKAFEKPLATDGQNLVAAEALIPLYEKGKDVRRLAEPGHLLPE